MFIKLHREDQDEQTPIWVNMNHIWSVESSIDGGSWLEIHDSVITVRETPEEIFSVISYFSC